jgi:NADH dehydrogenase/NADH:ubiquinone oxidoreductase subunit G
MIKLLVIDGKIIEAEGGKGSEVAREVGIHIPAYAIMIVSPSGACRLYCGGLSPRGQRSLH